LEKEKVKSERSERGIETFSILFLYFYFLYFSKKNTNVRIPLSLLSLLGVKMMKNNIKRGNVLYS